MSSEAHLPGLGSDQDTSLDPQETNVPPHDWTLTDPTSWGSITPDSFRHNGWREDRQRVIQAFDRLMLHENRQLHFFACGSDAWIERSVQQPNIHRIRATYCRDRWCKPCSTERGRQIAAVLMHAIEPKRTRLITLTLKHRDVGLRSQLDWLYKCFRRLRATRIWRRTQTGGAAILEVTYNADTQMWHPHLHILSVGTYIDQRALSIEWLRITGDSSIVDVRWVRNPTHAARYVTKYITKSVSSNVYRVDRALDEAILALKGRRMALTYGTWRGLQLRPKEPQGEWERVESFREYMVRLNRGEEDAIAMWCQFAASGTAIYPFDHPP